MQGEWRDACSEDGRLSHDYVEWRPQYAVEVLHKGLYDIALYAQC